MRVDDPQQRYVECALLVGLGAMDQVADDLVRQGVPAAPEDLIITAGSQQALDLVARTLVNPGDPFLVDESTYQGALSLLGVAGARLIGVPSDDEGPDLATLERHCHAGVKGLYVMPNCQNPTGTRISAAMMLPRFSKLSWI